MTFVAFLRGINVGGTKPVKMALLTESFKALGLKDVITFIQSGNVVFQTEIKNKEILIAKIKKQIKRDFNFDVPVIVKSAPEIAKIVKDNPILKLKNVDTTKLHVSFLESKPDKNKFNDLKKIASKSEVFATAKREIHLYCPNGYGQSKFTNNILEKILGVGATTRNWNTVNKILQMMTIRKNLKK